MPRPRPPDGRRRLIVADPGLTGAEGHHLHYSAGIAVAAHSHGLSPIVLSSLEFDGAIADGAVPVEPCFASQYQTSGGGGWPRRALFRALSCLPDGVAAAQAAAIRGMRRWARRRGVQDDLFGRELADWLRQKGNGQTDFVLMHSVSAANLASLPPHLAPESCAGLLIVLRRTPEDMDTDDPGPNPIGTLLRRLATRYGGKMVLFADTEPLAEIFRELTHLPVYAVPPPVMVPDPLAPAETTQLPRLVFIGGARREKGYRHLPDIARACRGLARLTIHAGAVTAASDPLVQRAHRALRRMVGPDLTLIEGVLGPDDYWNVMARADLVLLPYDPITYGPRSSGILVEALALGVPALVPAGCWMEHAGGPETTIAMRANETARVLVPRLLEALPGLARKARVRRSAWREAHSFDRLLTGLLAPLAGIAESK